MDTRQIILFFIFGFSVLLLVDGWQKANAPVPAVQSAQTAEAAAKADPSAAVPGSAPTAAPSAASAVPTPQPSAQLTAAPAKGGDAPVTAALGSTDRVRISTDLMQVELDTTGGDVRRVEFLRHKQTYEKDRNFVLLQETPQHTYVAQSGLIGTGLPTHRTVFRLLPGPLSLADGSDTLVVRMEATGVEGFKVVKRFTFRRDSYLVDVAYEITNQRQEPQSAFAYFQVVRDRTPPVGDSWLVPTYTGVAVYTDAEKYQKVAFDDIEKNKAKFVTQAGI